MWGIFRRCSEVLTTTTTNHDWLFFVIKLKFKKLICKSTICIIPIKDTHCGIYCEAQIFTSYVAKMSHCELHCINTEYKADNGHNSKISASALWVVSAGRQNQKYLQVIQTTRGWILSVSLYITAWAMNF